MDKGEKFRFWMKAFGIGLLGCTAGGVFIILIHYFLEFTGGIIYLLPGVIAVVFYLNFIQQEERTIGSHIATDISLLVGTLLVQLVDFAICYAPAFTVTDKPMNAIGKTFYTFFSFGGINTYEIQNGSIVMQTNQGTFGVWTAYITYVLCAIIGAYIVFGIVKLDSIMMAGNDKKGKKRNKK